MNVLNLTSSFPLYDGHGAGPFVLEEARALANLGYHQTVVTQHYAGSSYHEFMGQVEVRRFRWIEPRGYTRIREMADLSHIPHLLSYLVSAIVSSAALLGKRKIDVVYAQWALPCGLVGSVVSRLCRVPLVVVVHGADVLGGKPQKFPFRHITRWVFRNAVKILPRGEYLYERIEDIYTGEFRDKLVDIPIGLDAEEFSGHDLDSGIAEETRKAMGADGRPIVLTIRNLSPNYELEHLIAAIKAFKGICGSIRPLFVLIGGGTAAYKAKLDGLVESWGLGGDVLFLGPVDHRDMRKYIAACDVYVDPAVIGQGVACLEAMSLAKPAIGFHKKGAAIKIENERGGFLVELTSPPGAACEEMALKIKTLLENEGLRRQLGEGASAAVRRYRLAVTARAVADVLGEVARNR